MNAATQANCTALASRGVTLVTPDSGSMACGDTGQGRLAPVPVLLLYALQALAPQDMIGQKVLVTLGPTREPWDGVRFWSNPSPSIRNDISLQTYRRFQILVRYRR